MREENSTLNISPRLKKLVLKSAILTSSTTSRPFFGSPEDAQFSGTTLRPVRCSTEREIRPEKWNSERRKFNPQHFTKVEEICPKIRDFDLKHDLQTIFGVSRRCPIQWDNSPTCQVFHGTRNPSRKVEQWEKKIQPSTSHQG